MEQFLPFKEALVHARSWKLEGRSEWEAWAKSSACPANVPSRPEQTYKHEGWQGYGHWLGFGNLRAGVKKDQQFLPFKEALLHARSLKLKTQKDWKAWCKSGNRPANTHSNPHRTYKHKGWQGYEHWLGTGTAKDQQFLPFVEALLHARSLKLKGKVEWETWCKNGERPANIPSAPYRTYKHDGWQGYGHWLGTGNVAPKDQQFLPFKEALQYARSLKLKGVKEWRQWCKSGVREANMPSTPHQTYKHTGWQGYGHWLCTGTVAPQDKHFLPFKEALLHAHSLKLKGVKEWQAWCQRGERPANIPARPDLTYKHEGWQGIGHWLGTS